MATVTITLTDRADGIDCGLKHSNAKQESTTLANIAGAYLASELDNPMLIDMFAAIKNHIQQTEEKENV